MSNAITAEQIHQQAARVSQRSQATSIEQSRAVAEVQAMVLVAQRAPRDPSHALALIKESCSQMALAQRAFFSFSRGGGNVNGPSIHLATELARCWGNIDYGIMELDRDDVAGHTEMLAFAWDLETNTKSRQTFIVPHTRDTRQGKKPLTDSRDIYENNANNGARRLRECIFRVLPTYLKEEAEDLCRQVLERGEGDKPLPQRIALAVDLFAQIGISKDRIEARYGASPKWTPVELANLKIVYNSIKRGETSADEAFPKPGTDDVTADAKQLAVKAAGKRSRPKEADVDQGQQGSATSDTGEGRSDEQHGDQHDGTDDPSPAEAMVQDLIARIGAAENVVDARAVGTEWQKHEAALDDAQNDRIMAALDQRLGELKGAN